MQEVIKTIIDDYFPGKRTSEENKVLCEKYPFLKWYGDPLYMGYNEDHEPDLDYTWEDEIPEGWRKAFCPKLWDELKAILEKANYVNEFRFAQIKEKYGQLRIYYSGAPREIDQEIEDLFEKYLRLSEQTCIECGKPATRMSIGWISYFCDECAKERHKRDYTIPIADIDEYYDDRQAYFEKHKEELQNFSK